MDEKRVIERIVQAESGDKEEYRKFFEKKLKEYGVSSPAELDADKKKKFFEDVDKGWQSESEKEAKVAQEENEVGMKRPRLKALINAFASYLLDESKAPAALGDIKRLSKMDIVHVPDEETGTNLEIELAGEIGMALKRALTGVSYNRPVISKVVDAFAMILSGKAPEGFASLKVLAKRPRITEEALPVDEQEAIIDAVSSLVYRMVLKTLKAF
jgi:hypothetical protein